MGRSWQGFCDYEIAGRAVPEIRAVGRPGALRIPRVVAASQPSRLVLMNLRALRPSWRFVLPFLSLLSAGSSALADANGPPGAAPPQPTAAAKAEGAPPRNRHLTLEKMLRVRDGSSVGEDPGDFADARRAIDAEFHPTTPMITGDSKPAAVGKQILNAKPEPAPPGRVNVAPHGDLDVGEQVEAVHEAMQRPASTRSVDIVAVVDREGRILAIDVASPSGNAAFDRTALDSVKAALRDHPSTGQRTALRTRWRLTAGRAVRLPRVGSMIAPQTQGAGKTREPVRFGFGASGGMSFDETTGRVAPPPVPFSDKIETRIELISVESERQVEER